MKKKNTHFLRILAVIGCVLLLIAGIAGAAVCGVKILNILKKQVHISVQVNGNQLFGGDQAMLPPEVQTEEDTSMEEEESSEEQSEEATSEEAETSENEDGSIFGNGDGTEDFGSFGMFGGDSELAKALQEGLPAKGEAENPFLKEDFASHLGTNHTNHARDEFTGPYYDNICDSIDYSVDYGIERKYYEYLDTEKDITVQISCVQLSGDLPGIETLNQQIYQQTVEFAMMYSYQGAASTDTKKLIQVDSYVTFNDDTRMSIVLDELYETATGRYMDLYDLNLNLATGSILKDDFLKVDAAFVKEFRKRSSAQNGTENPGLDKLDDDMLQNYLNNEFTNIFFYTPLGMEIGVNYEVNNTVGWVTVTFEDYEKYLNAV